MTDSLRWGIVYCPKKRIGNLYSKHRQRLEAALSAENVDYELLQSESERGVPRLTKMLINQGFRTIVVVGGDGALNDALNVLMCEEQSVRKEVCLGVIPYGVMNDFAHFWGLRENDVEQSVQALARRRVRMVDVGCIRYRNKEQEACRRYFFNGVNMGYVASVMNLRRTTLHYLRARSLSFLLSFVLLLFQKLDYAMRLKINADEIRRKFMTVCIGSCTSYGQTPNAVPYNGWLDVSLVRHPAMRQLIEGVYLFVKGKFLNHKNVQVYRTKEVLIEETESLLVSVDGRLLKHPRAPYKVTVEQEVVAFLIP